MKDILAKSLLNKIERLEVFEERLNVRFENISINVDQNGWITVFLELHSNLGFNLGQLTQIECVAYGNDGQILALKVKHAFKDKFYGFEVFELSFQEDGIADKINKLRIYPKLP